MEHLPLFRRERGKAFLDRVAPTRGQEAIPDAWLDRGLSCPILGEVPPNVGMAAEPAARIGSRPALSVGLDHAAHRRLTLEAR